MPRNTQKNFPPLLKFVISLLAAIVFVVIICIVRKDLDNNASKILSTGAMSIFILVGMAIDVLCDPDN